MTSPSPLPVPPGTRIVYLFLLLLAGLFVAGLLLVLLAFVPGMENGGRAALYIGTTLQEVIAFMLPAYFVTRMSAPAPLGYLQLKGGPGMGQKLAFGVSVFILSYASVSFLNQWNKSIVLPESLHRVEEWMRTLEDAAMETTHLLLSGGSVMYLVLNLLIVAGLAALAEEIFFRGALQQFLQEKYKSGHAAVWVSALLFSIIHFQFYGFFPRLVLGALLGYLFLYTRNLWVPILVHFLNNATVIVLSYFWSDTEWMRDLEEAELTTSFAVMASVSVALTLLLFRNYRKRNARPVSNRAETPV